jgi:hypothetical protein
MKLSNYCFSKRIFMYKLSLVYCFILFSSTTIETQMEKQWRHLSLVAVIRLEVGEGERMTSPARSVYVFSFLPYSFTVTVI